MKERSVKVRTFRGRKLRQKRRTVIKVGSEFYVVASSLTSRRATRVLANGASFAIFDVGGDILEFPLEPLGFFHRDTRYLSRFELKVAGETPYYLNSHTSGDNAQVRINLSNPDLGLQGQAIKLPRNSIQIERNWVLADGTIFHKLAVRNYERANVELPLDFLFAVDFADLFEVRGIERIRRGEFSKPDVGRNAVRFSYRGLDGVRRFAEICFEPEPVSLRAGRASFVFTLKPNEQEELEVRIRAGCEEIPERTYVRFDEALTERRSEIARLDAGWSGISASNELLD
ncbi:MAG TPA: glycogen debranching N-terminal domain-containing protein, partial [Candidatus Binataceae bacterium]|nr:glycogen debranching N-terminal domain-containing protein [Candidatus Binataceae bacterium]